MLRIALQLYGPTLAGAHMQAASGGTLGAAAGVPCGDAGNLVFGLNEVGNQLLDLGRRTAGQRECAATGHAKDGEKLPAIYGGLRTFVSHWSSARRSSVASRQFVLAGNFLFYCVRPLPANR
jgi:hypothetical protein